MFGLSRVLLLLLLVAAPPGWLAKLSFPRNVRLSNKWASEHGLSLDRQADRPLAEVEEVTHSLFVHDEL